MCVNKCIWKCISSLRFPMSASCGGDGEEESVYAMLGLEFNHAYSILDVRQLGSERSEPHVHVHIIYSQVSRTWCIVTEYRLSTSYS